MFMRIKKESLSATAFDYYITTHKCNSEDLERIDAHSVIDIDASL